MITIDHFSAVTLPITMYFNDTSLSTGTAFMWLDAGRRYLITNWHNVTGKNYLTGAHLSPTAAEPNRIKVLFHKKSSLGDRVEKFIPLFEEDGSPRWFVHPQLGHGIDAIALPTESYSDISWYHINNDLTDDLQVKIGNDVFVLGYPFGVGPSGYPIWKRASIASEPEVFTLSQRYLLVDTASRPGMSGSPVLRRTWGTHMMQNGSMITNTSFMTRFIGIYSGRLSTNDASDAQLGLVWPAFYIQQIVDGRKNET